MSLKNKISLAERRANIFYSKEDIKKRYIGRSTKELGIHNREEVEERLNELYKELSELPELSFIKEIKKQHSEAGVWLVGGSVRDAILNKKSKDIDLVVENIAPVELVNILASHGKVIFDRNPKVDLAKMSEAEKEALISNAYGVIKFKPANSQLDEYIDIAFPRQDDYSQSGQSGILGIKRDVESKADPSLKITDDLARRDLTINAMALNLINGDIADPFDGIEDLVKRKIRAVGDPEKRILAEDLSRGFRALRFACVLGAEIDLPTKKAIKKIFQPSSISLEEIYKNDKDKLVLLKQYEEEVRKLFSLLPDSPLPRCLQVFWDKEQNKPRLAVPREVMSKEIIKGFRVDPVRFMQLLDEVGGLKIVFPEVAKLKNLAQPREYHREGDAWRHTLLVLENLPASASLRLKLAALFHDIGKALTQDRDKKGKITFYGHAKKGAELINLIAKRLRLPRRLAEEVSWLVENHMFAHTIDVEKIRAIKLERMFLENVELGADLLTLVKADAAASWPPDFSNIKALEKRLAKIKKQIKQKQEAEIPPFVTGNDLIVLGLKPGPIFRKILEEVRNAQLEEIIKTKEEAIEFVKKLIKKLDLKKENIAN